MILDKPIYKFTNMKTKYVIFVFFLSSCHRKIVLKYVAKVCHHNIIFNKYFLGYIVFSATRMNHSYTN